MWDEQAFGLAAQMAEGASKDRGELMARIRNEYAAAITPENKFAAAGARGVAIVEEACKDAVRSRIKATWDRFRDGLTEAGVEYSDDLAPRINAELGRILRELPADIREELTRAHTHNGVVGKDWLHGSLRGLTHLWDECVTALIPEVGVWCVGRRNGEQARAGAALPASGQHFYGTVGAVTIGNHNTTAVRQTFEDDGMRDRLQKALDQVEAALRNPDVVIDRKHELVEMVADAKSETEKPEPRWLRVKGYLAGVSQSIQTVAALQPAYEVIKAFVATL